MQWLSTEILEIMILLLIIYLHRKEL